MFDFDLKIHERFSYRSDVFEKDCYVVLILEEHYDIKPFEIKTIAMERIFVDKLFAAEAFAYYGIRHCIVVKE